MRSNQSLFEIPCRNTSNWFRHGLVLDTTSIHAKYEVPSPTDRSQEGYYSIFQIDHLHVILQQMTLNVEMDSFLDADNKQDVDWGKKYRTWLNLAENVGGALRTHEYRRSVALLCQYISNRYYFETQSDQRTIKVGSGMFCDQWIMVNGQGWSWHKEVGAWNPRVTEAMFNLTAKKLNHAYTGLAIEQAHCDPMEHWYQLTQFIAVDERKRLKGPALRAETLRSAAHMLRRLYKDLYGDELPHPNEITKTIIVHIPELAVRQDIRRYLEFVVNRFQLNPQPKLALIVEGRSEGTVVPVIFERYFGIHPSILGIEIIVLGSVDTATGSKREDRFRAILRLIDYLHHHQTMTFVILDNENYAQRLKQEAKNAKSMHSQERYITRPEYIKIWKTSFEFDNFSCTEIATALNRLAQGHNTFTDDEVRLCMKDAKPGSLLKHLYEQKMNYGLKKIELSEILVELMLSQTSQSRLERRPIIRVLNRVNQLAGQNRLPTMYDVWMKNQASKYLGKKLKTSKPR